MFLYKSPAWRKFWPITGALTFLLILSTFYIRRLLEPPAHLILPEHNFRVQFENEIERFFNLTVRSAPSRGALLSSEREGVFWVTPDGKRTILIPKNQTDHERLHGLWWDLDGSLWLLAEPHSGEPPGQQIWRWQPGQDATMVARVNNPLLSLPRLTRTEEGISIYAEGRRSGRGHKRKRNWFYAPIPLSGQNFNWKPAPSAANEVHRHRDWDIETLHRHAWFESGKMARLNADRRKLQQKLPGGKFKTWNLPGEALPPPDSWCGYFTGFLVSGKLLFFVPIYLSPGRTALVCCGPDGVARLKWDWIPDLVSAEGAFLSFLGNNHLAAIAPDGTFWPPFNFQAALRRSVEEKYHGPFKIVHMSKSGHESTIWMVVDNGRRMIAVDMTSGLLKNQWHLPYSSLSDPIEGEDFIHAADNGIFLNTGHSLYFIDWQGHKKSLGRV